MSAHERPAQASANPQAARRGLTRLWHAGLISISGLRLAWQEAAFRHELLWAVLLLPAAFFVGRDWVQTTVLCAVVMLVLIVELINSAVEAAIDRVGSEWHPLSKAAKDLGSAAVLLSLLLCAGTWATALWSRLSAT